MMSRRSYPYSSPVGVESQPMWVHMDPPPILGGCSVGGGGASASPSSAQVTPRSASISQFDGVYDDTPPLSPSRSLSGSTTPSLHGSGAFRPHSHPRPAAWKHPQHSDKLHVLPALRNTIVTVSYASLRHYNQFPCDQQPVPFLHQVAHSHVNKTRKTHNPYSRSAPTVITDNRLVRVCLGCLPKMNHLADMGEALIRSLVETVTGKPVFGYEYQADAHAPWCRIAVRICDAAKIIVAWTRSVLFDERCFHVACTAADKEFLLNYTTMLVADSNVDAQRRSDARAVLAANGLHFRTPGHTLHHAARPYRPATAWISARDDHNAAILPAIKHLLHEYSPTCPCAACADLCALAGAPDALYSSLHKYADEIAPTIDPNEPLVPLHSDPPHALHGSGEWHAVEPAHILSHHKRTEQAFDILFPQGGDSGDASFFADHLRYARLCPHAAQQLRNQEGQHYPQQQRYHSWY